MRFNAWYLLAIMLLLAGAQVGAAGAGEQASTRDSR